MKTLGKIALSKKYDVLSENEMMLVVGGSGSGSELDDCVGKTYYKCYEGPDNEMFYSRGCADNLEDAKSGFCTGRGANCMEVAVCAAG